MKLKKSSNKHKAIRTCTYCREAMEQKALIRMTRQDSGDWQVDLRGKANGRGLYLCHKAKCLEQALGLKKAKQPALKLSDSSRDLLQGALATLSECEDATLRAREEEKIFGLVGMATKSGQIANGSDAVALAIKEKTAKLLILAENTSERNRIEWQKKAEAAGIPSLQIGTKEEWGKQIGKRPLAVLAISDTMIAEGILQTVRPREEIASGSVEANWEVLT